MVIYISGLVLSVTFAFCSTHIHTVGSGSMRRRSIKTFFAILSFIPLTFIMAVRRGVGTDYGGYWRWFYGTRDSLEPAFKWLNATLRWFKNDPQLIFIVCAIIICGRYFIAIYRESVNPVYSVLLFVLCKDYFIAMNLMRQYVAGTIMLFAIPYIKERKLLKFLIVLAVAVSFHKSAIIFVFLYILYAVNLRPLIAGGIITGGFLFSAIAIRFILPLMNRIQFYAGYLSQSSKYCNTTGGISASLILIYLCFFILLAYIYKRVENNKNLKLMYSVVVMSLIMLSFGSVMPINFGRLSYYMNAFVVIYIPEAILSIDDRNLRRFIRIAIVVLYTIVTTSAIMSGNQGVLPYKTMWG